MKFDVVCVVNKLFCDVVNMAIVVFNFFCRNGVNVCFVFYECFFVQAMQVSKSVGSRIDFIILVGVDQEVKVEVFVVECVIKINYCWCYICIEVGEFILLRKAIIVKNDFISFVVNVCKISYLVVW